MQTENKTIIKAHEVIKARIQKLVDKKQNLRDWVDDRYPADTFGIKGEMLFDEKVKQIDEELKLLRKYDSGMYDLIEVIEKDGR